jgi:N-methylhydantoinase A
MIRLAADIGGTFTDIAAFDPDGRRLRLGKTLSTPARLVEGVSQGVTAGARFGDAALFLHGSTVAIIHARTHRSENRAAHPKAWDIYEIGRINRPDAYNLFFQARRS